MLFLCQTHSKLEELSNSFGSAEFYWNSFNGIFANRYFSSCCLFKKCSLSRKNGQECQAIIFANWKGNFMCLQVAGINGPSIILSTFNYIYCTITSKIRQRKFRNFRKWMKAKKMVYPCVICIVLLCSFETRISIFGPMTNLHIRCHLII